MHFILLIIGIALIVLNIGIIKEEKTYKKENFNENLNIAHDNMDKNEAEIMKMRKEMGETFYSLQEEIQDLKTYIEKLEDKIEKECYEKPVETVIQNIDTLDEEKVDEPEKVKVSNYNNVKIEEIKKLIDEGKNIEEICETLNMGKGEVLLIKDLYLE
ncbi:DUF6115 domain-containing protein [Clostridium cochlearium]|jgi:uncharacterized membrane-anchored protein YhcB (DUF1043 family)|uniref:Uncharacterized protein n=1 Tax=Clostridium cochlearium TaxID=1494 RepID=A0A240ABL0_CLOCO|nr:hypothetical protein [Clostridium cochlearium]MBV1819639.1 hypothetical protein [Bacteroidales bacterium MSK.15.36]NSJ91623.1 hypothetical protein [Coprococcus sp. MSK.21.13]MBE6065285.1 hypothetical protein [Clostridium cochlearium]MBU5269052.1 hypothetical protein [Clostridium cochlearium]MCG4570662.1 hypothetical protein [Clostridium cochlearium]